MARCDFSEYQFAFYHARELDRILKSNKVMFFPTAVKEKKLGYDFKYSTKYFSIFIQYKRPEFVKKPLANMKKEFSDGYFHINCFSKHKKDDTTYGNFKDTQYRTLKTLAQKERLVFYATPNFYKGVDFDKHSTNMLDNSSHFQFSKLPLPDDTDLFSPFFEADNHSINYDKSKFKFCSSSMFDIKDSFVSSITDEIKSEIRGQSNKVEKFNVFVGFMMNLYFGDKPSKDDNESELRFIQSVNSFRSYLFRKHKLLWIPVFNK